MRRLRPTCPLTIVVFPLARLEVHEQNLAAAESCLTRVISIDPSSHSAHWQLARILEDLGDLERTTLHLWRARDLDQSAQPRVPPEEYRQRLLRLYSRLSELEMSLPEVEKR